MAVFLVAGAAAGALVVGGGLHLFRGDAQRRQQLVNEFNQVRCRFCIVLALIITALLIGAALLYFYFDHLQLKLAPWMMVPLTVSLAALLYAVYLLFLDGNRLLSFGREFREGVGFRFYFFPIKITNNNVNCCSVVFNTTIAASVIMIVVVFYFIFVTQKSLKV
jgi:hypothetical protein